MADEENTDLTQVTDLSMAIDDTDEYKRARFEISEILEQRCKESIDANNVLARLEYAIRKTAHHGQENASSIEAAFGVGMKAFLDYNSQGPSPRSTRPR